MNAILTLSPKDRHDLFNEAGARLGLPPFHIEKDFWVCWTLCALFRAPKLNAHLTFRGGTSLSKGWDLIERFSEDIDLSMARGWFPDVKDPAEAGISSAERERRLKGLRNECRKVIAEVLCPVLTGEASKVPEPIRIEVEELEKARDPFCIYLEYPGTGLTAPADYNRAMVKIELSGRADGWPMEERTISPYVVRAFPDFCSGATLSLSCVRPERTFWEKAALVHEQNTRPGERSISPRQARHLYDLCRLWRVAKNSEGFRALFDGVVAHRRGYFDYTWVDYDALSPGSLRLVPPEKRLAEWRADYSAMQPMFFAEAPDFKAVIALLREIEITLAG